MLGKLFNTALTIVDISGIGSLSRLLVAKAGAQEKAASGGELDSDVTCYLHPLRPNLQRPSLCHFPPPLSPQTHA